MMPCLLAALLVLFLVDCALQVLRIYIDQQLQEPEGLSFFDRDMALNLLVVSSVYFAYFIT